MDDREEGAPQTDAKRSIFVESYDTVFTNFVMFQLSMSNKVKSAAAKKSRYFRVKSFPSLILRLSTSNFLGFKVFDVGMEVGIEGK